MNKISLPIGNDYCPQTLFLYGVFKDNGEPNFGLFCWFSYCWLDGLGVMACISGKKLTLERIRKTKAFSANLVTEQNIGFADHCGTAYGYNDGKMDVPYNWEKGRKLDVPILSDSPVSFELEVERIINLDDEYTDLILCKVKNVLGDPVLGDNGLSPEEKLARIMPVSTTCQTYFGWDGRKLGDWHRIGKETE